jgi:hypothetical protein
VAVLLGYRERIPQLPAQSAPNRANEGGLGIGLVQALRTVAHVPHDLQGASDLAFEGLSMAMACVMQDAYHTAGWAVEILQDGLVCNCPSRELLRCSA